MSACKAKKRSGEVCKGTALEGEKWCSFHKKKFAKSVTHGNTASPELLGIPKQEHLTFDQFHALKKPFELTTELAYLRTLVVEQRKAMESSRDKSREEFLEDLYNRSEAHLLEFNMKPAVIGVLLDTLHPVWVDIIEAHYGPVEPLQPEQFDMLANMIEKISRVAEKAKKIQEGITLNVEFKNVGPILVRFVREVIFAEIRDPVVRQSIVHRVRSMNLLGQSVKSLPQPEVVEEVFDA